MRSKYSKSPLFLLAMTTLIASVAIPSAAFAATTAPNLGTASTFALLAKSITNGNPVYVTGNVGSGINGQTSAPTIASGGTDYLQGPVYDAAIADLGNAIATAKAEQATVSESVPDIGGSNLTPGVYYFAGAANIGSSITLKGNGVYIFQVTGTLNTAANVAINLTNGAQASNVFWVVGGATTLAANTQFVGTIMSNAAITVGANSVVQGRILSTSAATVSTDTIVAPLFTETPAALPQTTVNTPYSQSLNPYTANGLPPLSWSVLAVNSLPLSVVGSVYSGLTPTSNMIGNVYGTTTSGTVAQNVYGQTVPQNVYQLGDGSLMLGGNGTFFGAPTTSGTISFNAAATDATGQTVIPPLYTPFTLAVNAATGGTTTTVTPPPSTGGTTPPNGTTQTGGTTTPAVPSSVFPTILTQTTLTPQGGTVNTQSGNTTTTLTVPSGAFTSSTQVTMTTGAASNVTASLPTGQTFVDAIGANFSGAAPSQPVSLLIKDLSITRSALVYQIAANGSLQPIPAQVLAGQASVTLSANADLVIVNPNLGVNQRQILWNGQQEQVANGFVAKDPLSGTPTTYMPIWYVMQILKQAGITSTWNGSIWNMSTTGTANLTNISPNSPGNMQIEINGTVVENVTGQVATDPAHGNMTSYMPIYWVFQALQRMGISSNWNGVTWNMTSQN